MAFYAFLSNFPAIAGLLSIYGLLTDPGELQEKMVTLESRLPAEGAKIVSDELQRTLVSSQRSQLGLSLAGGILIALWGTSKGMKATMNSMNVAYGIANSKPHIPAKAPPRRQRSEWALPSSWFLDVERSDHPSKAKPGEIFFGSNFAERRYLRSPVR